MKLDTPSIKVNGKDTKEATTNLVTTGHLNNSRSSLSHNMTYMGLTHNNSNNVNSPVMNTATSTTTKSPFKPSHNRTRSDQTGLFNSALNRVNSVTSTKASIGDLMSGRAFDNNCNCIEQQQLNSNKLNVINSLVDNSLNESNSNDATSNCHLADSNLNGIDEENKENELMKSIDQEDKSDVNDENENKFECLCNAPRLAPEYEFTKSLILVGKKLIRLATKELKSI